MRLGRIEAGKWCTHKDSAMVWFEYLSGKNSCGCVIVTVCNIYVTWLGYECYGVILEKKGKSLKRLANIRRVREELLTGRTEST